MSDLEEKIYVCWLNSKLRILAVLIGSGEILLKYFIDVVHKEESSIISTENVSHEFLNFLRCQQFYGRIEVFMFMGRLFMEGKQFWVSIGIVHESVIFQICILDHLL